MPELKADHHVCRTYLETLFAAEDIIQLEAYPKPNTSGGPARRYSIARQELNDRMLDQMQELNNAPTFANWYVRINPLNRRMGDRSARDVEIARIRCLWLDLDKVKADSVLLLLSRAGWPEPHVIVRSGGVGREGNTGAQVMFKLSAPLVIQTGDQAALNYARDIVRAMLVALKDDPSTCNPSRLMRVPGFWNVKYPDKYEPRLAELVYCEGDNATWTAGEWAKLLQVQQGSAPKARPAETPEADRPSPQLPILATIVAGCAFMQHCRADAAKLPEPEWYAALSIAALCKDGRIESHKLSESHPGYKAAATDAKIDQAIKASGPRTCEHIKASLGHAACEQCQHWSKLTSPIELGYRRSKRPTMPAAMAARASILARVKDKGEDVLTGVLEDPAEMEALAFLCLNNQGQFKAMLIQLVDRCSCREKRVQMFERAIQSTADQQVRRQRAKQYEAAAQGDRVIDVLKGAPVGEALMVPPGYTVTRKGEIHAEKITARGEVASQLVTSTPLLITGIMEDIDDQQQYVQIAWRSRGQWHQMIVERYILKTSTEIIKPLSERGIAIDSDSKMHVIRWLTAFEQHNGREIPRVGATTTMGWQRGPRFLIGRTVITAHGMIEAAAGDPREWQKESLAFRPQGEGNSELLDGFHAKGTLEGWIAAVEPLKDYPLAQLGIYTAIASPLLALLKQPPLILEWADRSSTGKTTTLKIAASTCGNPFERAQNTVIHSWSSTLNAVCRIAAILRHLPLLMDDTRKARQKAELMNAIYDFSGGRERMRAGLQGLQRAGNWSSCMLSTGESKITDFAPDQEGGHARVISVWGRPFGEKSEATGRIVDRVSMAIERNYGHAMPRVLAHVLSHWERIDDWRKWHEDSRAGFCQSFADAGVTTEHLAHRVSGALAALQLAAVLTHEAIALPWEQPDMWELLQGAVLEGVNSADTARVALGLLIEDAATRREAYYDQTAQVALKEPLTGWRGRWDRGPNWEFVGFTNATIANVLERAQIEVRRVRRAWADNGWLLLDKQNKSTVPQRLGTHVIRLLCVKHEAVDEIAGKQPGTIAGGLYADPPAASDPPAGGNDPF